MRDRGVRVTGGMHVGKGEGVVGLHGRRDGHCSGWYASYWNAFLFPIEFFAVFTKMIDVTFLPMLYTWTNASILSYVTTVSYAEDLIPDICGQHLKITQNYTKVNIYNTDRNVRSVTSVETAKNSNAFNSDVYTTH